MDFRLEDRPRLLSESMDRESDRGCVLLGAEMLSNDLEFLLRAFFRTEPSIVKKTINPLFKGFSPLATFAARIELAYAMGLIPKVVQVRLHLVRELRNLFAHTATHLDLSDPKCKPILDKLAGTSKDFPSAQETSEMTFGKQKLTKREFKDRLAFLLVISRVSTIMEFLEVRLSSGHDARRDVLAFEKNRTFEDV